MTSDEMLELWMLRRYRLPVRADASVTRRAGIDVERLARVEMRGWYLDLLDRGDERYLAVSDVAGKVAVARLGGGRGMVRLPADVRRVLEVKLRGWERPAVIVADEAGELWRRQANEYARAGVCRPVALVSGGRLWMNGVPDDDEGAGLETLRVVADAGEDVYELDDAALTLIPDE